MFAGKARAYPRGEHLKGRNYRVGPRAMDLRHSAKTALRQTLSITTLSINNIFLLLF
jgi:hypothetical protein